tara:strand:- start:2975 stop:3181 length:207 start_codon:yes stop_codon:yes gene_type:complete
MEKNLFYIALKRTYEAERDEALAVMTTFFEKPTGVAEHTTFIEDLKKYTKQLADAEECLRTLEIHFEK